MEPRIIIVHRQPLPRLAFLNLLTGLFLATGSVGALATVGVYGSRLGHHLRDSLDALAAVLS